MARSRVGVIELRKCTEGETPLITHSHLSRRGLMTGAAGLALAAPAAAPARAAGTLSVVDTVSGPNFQAFWSTYLIPKIRKDFGVEIKYTVGSGPTLQLQMQSWRQDEPGFSLLFLKDLDLANMVSGRAEVRSALSGARGGDSQPGADRQGIRRDRQRRGAARRRAAVLARPVRADPQHRVRQEAAEDLGGVLRPPRRIQGPYRHDPAGCELRRRARGDLCLPRRQWGRFQQAVRRDPGIERVEERAEPSSPSSAAPSRSRSRPRRR